MSPSAVPLADAILPPAATCRERTLGVTLVGLTAESALKLLFTATSDGPEVRGWIGA